MPAAKPFTVKSIEAIKPDASRKEIPDGGLQGLYLIVQPTGVKSWAVRYRHAGKPRKMTLGGFPAISLGDAREKARNALRMVSEGRDPATEQAEQETRRPAHMDLMPALLDEFVTRHVAVKNRPSYVRETKRIIETTLKPKWKQKLVKTVTKRDVLRLLDEIVDRGSPIMANRVRALLSKFFAWAMERDIVDASPRRINQSTIRREDARPCFNRRRNPVPMARVGKTWIPIWTCRAVAAVDGSTENRSVRCLVG